MLPAQSITAYLAMCSGNPEYSRSTQRRRKKKLFKYPQVLCFVMQGDLHVVYGTGFVGGSEVGLRADEAIPHLTAQHGLQHLRLSG